MPIAVQWIIGFLIVAAYGFITWMALDIVINRLVQKIQKRKFNKRKDELSGTIANILTLNLELREKAVRIENNFSVIFEKDPAAINTTTELIKAIRVIYKEKTESKDDFNAEYSEQIFEILIFLEDKAQFSSLPAKDREWMEIIKNLLAESGSSNRNISIQKIICTFTDDKNKEIELLNKKPKINRISLLSLLITAISLGVTLYSIFGWPF